MSTTSSQALASPAEKSPMDTSLSSRMEGTKDGRKVIPPPPPQSGFREFLDRRFGGVMQILGLI
ncbi:hypothetical protein N431DRAFT_437738 [Stipitochalara longipes BDJ]|nr:hypothetical protein N431DRAFT_437738 [Stipitochalara longipes BDJ]